jgi:hypothetical protein
MSTTNKVKTPNAHFEIKREKVNSSNIRSIGHDKRSNTLEVEFYQAKSAKGGDVWRYYPISALAYSQLKKAKSVGSHFVHNIKNNILITQQKMTNGTESTKPQPTTPTRKTR